MNTLNIHGVELSVTVNGRPTRTYLHEGKYFIESRDGTEYAIEIKNNNWYRVEAVVAVDGLSVITGKPASKEDAGYIVSSYDRLVIKGFRKDLNEVGAFKFTKKENSYAATKGQADNVGVIAIAIHKEKNYIPTGSTTIYAQPAQPSRWKPTWDYTVPGVYKDSTAGSPSFFRGASSASDNAVTYCNTVNMVSKEVSMADAQAVNFVHGTTWGQKITDKVVNVSFERDFLLFTTEIFYNSKESLEAMGIKLIQEKQVNLPKGFPVDFAEPPPGWKG